MATVPNLSLFLSPPQPRRRPPLASRGYRLSLVFPVTSPSLLSVSHFRRKGMPAISSLPAGSLISDAEQVPNPPGIATASGDGASIVISALFLTAFIALSVLTAGVIYLAVTDFIQRRESEKLDREEASKRKKKKEKESRRRGKVASRAKSGPLGFGQKIVEEDDEDN
ncbi:unnamed protein product [Cuscuta campestris]|nr:unnamed protein product [Cuscuta campestris]